MKHKAPLGLTTDSMCLELLTVANAQVCRMLEEDTKQKKLVFNHLENGRPFLPQAYYYVLVLPN